MKKTKTFTYIKSGPIMIIPDCWLLGRGGSPTISNGHEKNKCLQLLFLSFSDIFQLFLPFLKSKRSTGKGKLKH